MNSDQRCSRPHRSAFPRVGYSCLLGVILAGCSQTPPYRGTDRYCVPDHPGDVVVYRDCGPRDGPLTVLLAHGASISKVQWKEVESRLDDKYRTINIDLPGHGESSKHASWLGSHHADRPPDHPYTMTAQGGFLCQFIEDLNLGQRGNLVLVGSSYGGGIVLESYLKMSPEQRAQIRGIFLMQPAAHYCRKPEHYDEVRNLTHFPLNLMLNLPPTLWLMKKLAHVLYPDPEAVDEAVIDDWARSAVPIARQPGASMIAVRVLVDVWDELRWRAKLDPDDRHRYACITCPVYVAWGELDSVLDISGLLVLQNEIPDCHTRVIWGAGHDFLGLKDKQAIEWLEECLTHLSDKTPSNPTTRQLKMVN